MSRSRKGSKGPGYEYWGKRASETSTVGHAIGHETKKLTSRKLRRAARKVKHQW